MNHPNHREFITENRVSSIENPDIYVPIRHSSTTVENSLQIGPFMQNKPNFQMAKMSASNIITMNYKNFIPLAGYKNKPNSNPIKPNFKKAKMNISSIITKDYRKNDCLASRKNKPNSNPISVKPKMSANLHVIEDYENVTAFRLQKNKPKQTQFPKGQNELNIACRKIWPHPFYIAGHKNIDEHLKSQYTTVRT